MRLGPVFCVVGLNGGEKVGDKGGGWRWRMKVGLEVEDGGGGSSLGSVLGRDSAGGGLLVGTVKLRGKTIEQVTVHLPIRLKIKD